MAKNDDFKPLQIDNVPTSSMFIPDRIRCGLAKNNSTGLVACVVQFIDTESSSQPAPMMFGRESVEDLLRELAAKLPELTAP